MGDMINPEKIYGENWKDGDAYALDVHTLSSEFAGYNEFGHPLFNNKYSHIGELLHNLKYNKDSKAADEIVNIALPRLKKWLSNKNVSLVVPAPFSTPRQTQPVFLLAEKFAECLGINCKTDLLEKTSAGQSKNQDKGVTVKPTRNEVIPHNVLLIDDIFDTGATLNACVKVLKNSYKVKSVYILCITQKRNRIIRM